MPLALSLMGCSSDTPKAAGAKAPPSEPPAETQREKDDDQTLPSVPFALPSFKSANEIRLTRTSILFNSKTVAAIKDGTVDPAAVERHLIGSLFDACSEDVEKDKQLAARQGVERDANLVVFADASTTFGTLVDVLYTAGRAEFQTYDFVATTGPGTSGAVRVDPPRFGDSNGPAFKVFILREGLRVGTAGTSELIPTIAGKTGAEAYDYAALANRATKHESEHGKTTAVVSAETDARYGVVVRTMATLAGERCAESRDACLLPDVVVEAGAG